MMQLGKEECELIRTHLSVAFDRTSVDALNTARARSGLLWKPKFCTAQRMDRAVLKLYPTDFHGSVTDLQHQQYQLGLHNKHQYITKCDAIIHLSMSGQNKSACIS